MVAKYGNKRKSQTKANAKFSTFSSVSSNNHGLENVTMNLEDYWDLLFLFILPKFLFALKFDVPLWININQSASRYLVMIMIMMIHLVIIMIEDPKDICGWNKKLSDLIMVYELMD